MQFNPKPIRQLLTLVIACSATAVFSGAQQTVFAQEIVAVSPPGLRIGHVTTLVLTGKNLSDDAKLVAPFPARVTSVSANNDNTQLTMDVELSESIEAGITHFRLQTGQGISKPQPISLDQLIQLPTGENKVSIDPMERPVSIYGTINSSALVEVELNPSESGQVCIEIESARLGTNLRPVLRLLDQDGVQVAFAFPNATLGGDTRLLADLEQGNKYRLELIDQLRRAPANSYFRMKVGQFNYSDLAAPVFANRRKFLRARLGENHETSLTDYHANTLHWNTVNLPGVNNYSGTRPIEFNVDGFHLDLTDKHDFGKHELSVPPVAVSAILNSTSGAHQFEMSVCAGQVLRVEMLAEQIGSALDGVITVFDAASGKQLVQADDYQTSSDPKVDFSVPQNVNRIRIEVKDITGARAADFLYGLTVSDISAGAFEVQFDNPQVTLAPGQRQLLKMTPVRMGYQGTIYLDVLNAPPQLKFHAAPILPGADQGFITIENTSDESVNAVPIYVRAYSENRAFQTIAKSAQPIEVFRQPWLSHQAAIASVMGNGYHVATQWNDSVDPNQAITVFSGGETVVTPIVNAHFPDAYDGKKEIEFDGLTSVIPTPTVNGKKATPTKYAPVINTTNRELATASFNVVAPSTTPVGQYYLCVNAKLIDRRMQNNQLANSFLPPVLVSVEEGIKLSVSETPAIVPGAKETTLKFKCNLEVNPKIETPIQIRLVGIDVPKEHSNITVQPGQKSVDVELKIPSNYSLAQLSATKIRAIAYDPGNADSPIAATEAVALFPGK